MGLKRKKELKDGLNELKKIKIYYELLEDYTLREEILAGRNLGGKKIWRNRRNLIWRMPKKYKFGGNLIWRM